MCIYIYILYIMYDSGTVYAGVCILNVSSIKVWYYFVVLTCQCKLKNK